MSPCTKVWRRRRAGWQVLKVAGVGEFVEVDDGLVDWASQSSTKLAPMKPAPPVTRIMTVHTYRRLLSFTRRHWPLFALSFVGFVIYGVSNAAFAHIMKLLIDSIQAGERREVFFPLLIVGLFAARGIGSFLGAYSLASVAKELVHDLQLKLYDTFAAMPASRYDTMESSALISKLTYGVGTVADSVTTSLKTLLQEGLYVIGLLVYIFWLNWRLASVFIVVSPVIAWLAALTGKRFRKIAQRMINSQSQIIQTASESIKGYREIRIFGTQQPMREKFRTASDQYRRQSRKMDLTRTVSSPLVQMMVSFALAFLVWLALNPVTGGTMSSGDFIAFLLAVSMLVKPIKDLTEVNGSLQKGIGSAELLFQYLDLDAEKDEGTDTTGLRTADIRCPRHPWNRLAAEDRSCRATGCVPGHRVRPPRRRREGGSRAAAQGGKQGLRSACPPPQAPVEPAVPGHRVRPPRRRREGGSRAAAQGESKARPERVSPPPSPRHPWNRLACRATRVRPPPIEHVDVDAHTHLIAQLGEAAQRRRGSSALAACSTEGWLVSAWLTQVITSVSASAGRTTGVASACGLTWGFPTSCSSASFFTRRSFWAAISWAITRS
jgi:hypothetical protein